MGMFFTKAVDAFLEDSAYKIVNRRLQLGNFKYLDRVDLTYQSTEDSIKADYPYLPDLSTLKQLLPVPSFLLRPLKNYRLPYERATGETPNFGGHRTIIYLHGSGSIAEDNSILHRMLIQNGCALIRVSYHINYEKDGIIFPKQAIEMLPFLTRTEAIIAPAFNDELKTMLTRVKDEYPSLLMDKEVVLIGHSLGGGLAANVIASLDGIHFVKFINLDGTLMNPALQTGLKIKQLHLSQDQLFKKEWLDEGTFTDPTKAIGQDYCKKIDMLLNHSSNRKIWIQIKDTSHFTFTDFPDLLRPFRIFRSFVGAQESAARIRRYVLQFILDPDEMQVDSQDIMIKDER